MAKRKMSEAQKKALAKGRAALNKKRGLKKPIKIKKAVKKLSANKSISTMGAFVAKTKTTKTQKPTKRKRAVRKLSSMLGGRSGALDTLKTVGLTMGGGIAAGLIANKLPIKDPRFKAALPIAAGVLIASTVGRKNVMIKSVATGMAVLGAVALFKQMAPQIPMLAGEVSPDQNNLLSYQNSDVALLGENVNFGDEDDIEDIEGEVVDYGEDNYFSPADL